MVVVEEPNISNRYNYKHSRFSVNLLNESVNQNKLYYIPDEQTLMTLQQFYRLDFRNEIISPGLRLSGTPTTIGR